MITKTWKQMGNIIMLTGIFHVIFGVVTGLDVWKELFRAGLWNSIQTCPRSAVFWFTFLGVPFIVLGQLAQWYIRKSGNPLPKFVGAHFLWIGLLGFLFVPASGFPWLALIGLSIFLQKQPGTGEI